MAYETIVVAYDEARSADEAVLAIRRMGIPRHDIRRHPVEEHGLPDVADPPGETSGSGFWNWLFGGEAQDTRIARYERALERGGTVISVRVLEESVGEIVEALERFGPIDLAASPPE